MHVLEGVEKQLVNLTINGRQIQAKPGRTILEVAREQGIEIPTLCYDPALRLVGSCRMCIVEIQGWRNQPASCTTPVAEGMVVFTESPSVVESRRLVLELLLANHPQDCLTCEKSGDCQLQDYAYRYGVRGSRFQDGGPYRYEVKDPNPFIIRDYNKCIMCTKCVRACEEITGAFALNVENRGHQASICAGIDGTLAESTCIFCGQCVMVCPTGALTNRPEYGQARRWETKKVLTTCGYCAVGCTFELNVKDNRIVGVTSDRSPVKSPVNRGALCVKGRYGWGFINSPDRLTDPLIKENGEFRPATWEEALDLVASRLGEIKEQHGPDSLMVISSARTTNEENYLAQKFARAVLGTNNVDNCARL